MLIFEVIFLDEEPFMGTRKVVQGNKVSDILNETSKEKVFLLVDHETRRIWKAFGPESPTVLKMHAITLAATLNSQLQLSYEIDDLVEYSRDHPDFQEILEKKIDKKIGGSLAKSIAEISESLAKSVERESQRIIPKCCNHCGAYLAKEASICHACGNKVD